MSKLWVVRVSPSSVLLIPWTITTNLTTGWRDFALAMAAGAFQLSQPLNQGLMYCRNVLKLKKEKRLAQERGESSVTETPPTHERRDNRPSKRVDFRHHAAPS